MSALYLIVLGQNDTAVEPPVKERVRAMSDQCARLFREIVVISTYWMMVPSFLA